MMLYFTPLPPALFGINSCCSLMTLVCDSLVHVFFKTMATAIYILCAVCFAAMCNVWFSSVLTPTT